MKTVSLRMGLTVLVMLLILPLFTDAAACSNLYRNISFGSRGQDVVSLQNFLIEEGDLAAGNNSGYYGRLTESAVKKWQTRNNVVSSGTPSTTGYGAVGPKTRAKIASVCGSGGTVSVNFSASPMSGTAPLKVSFSGSVLVTPFGYNLQYGDGTTNGIECNPGSKSGCTFNFSHIYTNVGTYTVKLTVASKPPVATLATATITVTGTLVTPNDKQSCENIGGKWGSVGDSPNATPYCNMPTSDSGKACADSSQCQSFCQATTYAEPGTPIGGACYGWKEASCTGGIANGKAVPVACY